MMLSQTKFGQTIKKHEKLPTEYIIKELMNKNSVGNFRTGTVLEFLMSSPDKTSCNLQWKKATKINHKSFPTTFKATVSIVQ